MNFKEKRNNSTDEQTRELSIALLLLPPSETLRPADAGVPIPDEATQRESLLPGCACVFDSAECINSWRMWTPITRRDWFLHVDSDSTVTNWKFAQPWLFFFRPPEQKNNHKKKKNGPSLMDSSLFGCWQLLPLCLIASEWVEAGPSAGVSSQE